MMMRSKAYLSGLLLGVAAIACSGAAAAKVTRIVLEATEPAAFAEYEILSGRAYGEIDPRDGRNRIITDIAYAPRNARGMVEYSAIWGLRLSPNFIGTDATGDIPLPAEVRRYYFTSTGHGGSYGKGFMPTGDPRPQACTLPGNPNPSEPTLRAVQQALLDWVVRGKVPPSSRYPTLAAGDLVAPTSVALGWPAIPGAPAPDGKLNPLVDQDFGSTVRYNDLSGIITRQPPTMRRTMPSLVPRLNADGNETAGVPSVHLLVPLGTYLGWNVEARGVNAGQRCSFEGGFIPFARSKADRLARGDPRPSLEERYTDHPVFVSRVREVAAGQVAAGWLLPQDADKIVRNAEESRVLR